MTVIGKDSTSYDRDSDQKRRLERHDCRRHRGLRRFHLRKRKEYFLHSRTLADFRRIEIAETMLTQFLFDMRDASPEPFG